MKTSCRFFQSTIVLIACTFSFSALAADEWLCTSESSQRTGNTFQVCGVGEAASESEARLNATKNAVAEFKVLCENDETCAKSKNSVNPKRQTCSKADGQFKCVRLVEFTVTPSASVTKAPEQRAAASAPDDAQESSPAPASAPVPASTPGHAIIRIGLSKEDLIKGFGKPETYVKVDEQFLIFNYTNPEFCERRCTIGLKNDDVYKFDGFKIEYTDLLETKSFWQKLKAGAYNGNR